jgi:5-methylcytosine-specific restriction endonuclease McrA
MCGLHFQQNRGVGRKRQTCSRTCRDRKRKQNPTHALVCLSCGGGFKSTVQRQQFCSGVCRGASRRTLKGTARACARCAASFEPAHRARKFCSLRCASFGRQGSACRCGATLTSGRICADCRRTAKQSKWHNATARRRAITHDQIDRLDRVLVYRRDDGTCRICWGRISEKARYPDRASLSIDHIIPLARGGSHTYNNVRAAHLACNVRRNDARVHRKARAAA